MARNEDERDVFVEITMDNLRKVREDARQHARVLDGARENNRKCGMAL
jgi:hypothetical protein